MIIQISAKKKKKPFQTAYNRARAREGCRPPKGETGSWKKRGRVREREEMEQKNMELT